VALSRIPQRGLAVITCMDTRIDPLASLGIALGDAVVVRNAGGRVTDDALRSVLLAVHELDVTEAVVMEHKGCALAGADNDALRRTTGADLDFLPIADHDATLRADVQLLADHAALTELRTIRGALLDLDTGAVTEVVRVER
jgi:carbonic anhydrase